MASRTMKRQFPILSHLWLVCYWQEIMFIKKLFSAHKIFSFWFLKVTKNCLFVFLFGFLIFYPVIADIKGNLNIFQQSVWPCFLSIMRECHASIFKLILIYTTSKNLAFLTLLLIFREKGEEKIIIYQMLGWPTFLLFKYLKCIMKFLEQHNGFCYSFWYFTLLLSLKTEAGIHWSLHLSKNDREEEFHKGEGGR